MAKNMWMVGSLACAASLAQPAFAEQGGEGFRCVQSKVGEPWTMAKYSPVSNPEKKVNLFQSRPGVTAPNPEDLADWVPFASVPNCQNDATFHCASGGGGGIYSGTTNFNAHRRNAGPWGPAGVYGRYWFGADDAQDSKYSIDDMACNLPTFGGNMSLSCSDKQVHPAYGHSFTYRIAYDNTVDSLARLYQSAYGIDVPDPNDTSQWEELAVFPNCAQDVAAPHDFSCTGRGGLHSEGYWTLRAFRDSGNIYAAIQHGPSGTNYYASFAKMPCTGVLWTSL